MYLNRLFLLVHLILASADVDQALQDELFPYVSLNYKIELVDL